MKYEAPKAVVVDRLCGGCRLGSQQDRLIPGRFSDEIAVRKYRGFAHPGGENHLCFI